MWEENTEKPARSLQESDRPPATASLAPVWPGQGYSGHWEQRAAGKAVCSQSPNHPDTDSGRDRGRHALQESANIQTPINKGAKQPLSGTRGVRSGRGGVKRRLGLLRGLSSGFPGCSRPRQRSSGEYFRGHRNSSAKQHRLLKRSPQQLCSLLTTAADV